MKSEEVEKILKDAGWQRTISAPPDVIDYQRFPADFKERVEYNRLILYPEHMKRLNEVILQKLMETNIPEHGEVWEEVWKEVEEKPTEVPEGVTLAKFEMKDEEFAKIVEDIFEAVMSGKYEFRSAVNYDNHVRTVMYEKGKPGGTRIEMLCKDSDTAWSLQQTIDWTYKYEIEVVAVRRMKNVVEVAYTRIGIPAPPYKEKLIYTFKKTDGWTLTGEPKH